MGKTTLSGLLLLLITVMIIIFAYYTTIIIGKKTNKLFHGSHIQVLERVSIGLNTSITILKIHSKIYIIAFYGKSMELLDTIDEENWHFTNTTSEKQFSFPDKISDLIKKDLFQSKK